MEGISFVPTSTETEGVVFENKPVVSSNEARVKAEQISVALTGYTPLDPSEVQNVIEFDGTDASYRETLAQIEADSLGVERSKILNESLESGDADTFASVSMVDTSKAARPKETNIEQAYGERIYDTAEAIVTRDAEAEDVIPSGLDKLRDWADDSAFNVTIGKQLLAKYQQEDTDNPLQDIYDFAQGMIPFRAGALLSNETPGFEGKFFQGTGGNVLDQIRFIQGIEDKAERKRVLEETVSGIAESSQDAAQEFLSYYINMTSRDAVELTVLTEGLDFLDVAGGKALTSALKGSTSLSKSIIKGMTKKNVVKGVAEETADASSSVAVSLARKNDATKTQVEIEAGEMYDTYFSVFNPERIFTGDSNITSGAQQAVREHLLTATSEVAEKLRAPNFGVDRLSPLEFTAAVDATRAEIRRDFKGHRFLNLADEPVLNPTTNTYRIGMYLGRKDGSLFKSEDGAKNFADKWVKLKTGDYEIFEQGGQYAIKITRDVDEFAGFKQSLGTIETNEKFNDSLTNLFIGRLRETGGVEGAGPFNARLASLHGAQDMFRTFQTVSKPYFDLIKRKDQYEELGKVFNYLRETKDARTGQIGKWADTDAEFENIFFMQNGKNPTTEQHLAYWSYRQASDIEKILADTSRHATYVRLGAKRVSTRAKIKDKQVDISGIARTVDSLPAGKENQYFKIALIDRSGNLKIISNKSGLDDYVKIADGADIVKAVEGEGIKIGKQRVHYIVSEGGLRKDNLRLEDTGTGYTGGGHLANEHPFYVKIPGIEDDIYIGDNTLVNAFSLKQAKEVADNFNKAKNLFLENKAGWAKIVDDQLPFLSREDFKGLMKGARADINAVGVRAGQRSTDSTKLPDGVLNYNRSELDELGDYERRFAEERTNPDLKIMREEVKGQYTVEPAPKLDPAQALIKGVNVAVTARMQKDALVRSSSAWVKQFADKTKYTPEQIWRDPLGFLNDPDPYLPNVWSNDPTGRFQAETARQAMLRQIDQGTVTSRMVNMLNEHIHGIMNGRGQKPLPQLHRLPQVKDPLVFARALSYNMYLGLFNLQQIAVQGIGTMHLAAVAPRYWQRSLASAMALRSATYTSRQNILSHFGKSFSKFTGLSKDEFAKMATDMRTSGWSEMGGSMAQIADDVTGNIAQSTTDKLLDWGRVIPTSVDRFHRLAGWSAAWMEKKAAKGSTDFTRQELQEILRRANVLSANMSSANNAAWQRGALAPATQFMSYPMRIMEQVLPALVGKGSDLTAGEAWRVFTLQSALFGFTAGGLGAAAGGIWSFDQTLREEFLKRGIEVDDSYGEVLMDGVPAFLIEYFSGENGLKEGADIDLNRLALSNESLLQKLVSNDVSWGEFFGGPAGGLVWELMKSTADPAIHAYRAAFADDKDAHDIFPVLKDDFTEVARRISTIDVGFKARDAIFRGVWSSRTGVDETEVGLTEALLSLASGGTPQSVTSSRLRRSVMYQDKQRDTKIRKEIKELYSKALKSDDKATRRSYISQAKITAQYYNIDPIQLQRILNSAAQEGGMRVERIEELFRKDAIKRGRQETPLTIRSE